MALEIERKFLCTLTREQAIELSFASRGIKSIYLENTPLASTRVVKDTHDDGEVICKWTEKRNSETGNLLARLELEEELPTKIFDAVDTGKYPTVTKHRYLIDVNDSTWEVDFFDDYNFVVAELEFDSVAAAEKFSDFPEWISLEVTHDPEYLNCNLAK